jgi:hypothetical protein
MKTRIFSILTTFVLSIIAILVPTAYAATDQPRTFLVVVPGTLPADSGRAVVQALGELVAGASVGDRIAVYDGIALKSIADLTVPEARTAVGRVNKLRTEFGQLRAHLLADAAGDGNSLLVNLPGAYRVAAGLAGKDRLRILAFASALPLDEDGSGPLCQPGLVPSDGFVLDTSINSAFGTSDRGRDYLAGVKVDFCVLGPRMAELDRRPLERFYTIHAAALGAVLHTFTDDPALAVRKALAGGSEPGTSDTINADDRVKEIRRAGGSDPIPTAELPERARRALREAAAGLPAGVDNLVHVAVVWTSAGSTDIDLYVKASATSEEIGYAAARATSAGRYLRDVVRTPNQSSGEAWRGEWEGIVLPGADVAALDIWLNTFRNRGGEVSGFVRVQDGTRGSVDIPFVMRGTGDGATDRARRAESTDWLRVDVKTAFEAARAR